jgi:hypothetical protein
MSCLQEQGGNVSELNFWERLWSTLPSLLRFDREHVRLAVNGA